MGDQILMKLDIKERYHVSDAPFLIQVGSIDSGGGGGKSWKLEILKTLRVERLG